MHTIKEIKVHTDNDVNVRSLEFTNKGDVLASVD